MAAGQPDISQILASLAGPRPPGQPQPYPPGSAGAPPAGGPPAAMPHQYPLHSPPPHMTSTPGVPPPHTMPPGAPGSYPPPQAQYNLGDVKPVNSGSMSVGAPGSMPPGPGYPSGYPVPTNSGTFRSRSRSPRRSPDRYGRDRRSDDRAARYPSPSRGRDYMENNGANFSPLSGRRVPGAAGGGDSQSETIMIESSAVGLVIGRQGDNMRRLEGSTRTRIQFAPPSESKGSPMRRCTITGSASAIESAIREINRIIDENEKGGGRGGGMGRAPAPGGRGMPEYDAGRGSAGPRPANGAAGNSKDEPAMTIMIPSKTVGLVIGKGGESIKQLQDRSQCHVNIMPEAATTPDGLRPVHLLGTPAQAAVARDMILNIVQNDAKAGIGGGPGGGGGMPGPYAGGAPGGPPGSTAPGDGREIHNVHVPSAAVGKIIGKGGESVREMQEVSGCKINVFQPSGRDIERQIELIGTRPAITVAERLIMDKVREVQSKNAADPYATPAGFPQPAAAATPSYGTYAAPGAVAAATEPPGGHEAYAAYGGYDNYVKLWYASQQAQPPGQAR